MADPGWGSNKCEKCQLAGEEGSPPLRVLGWQRRSCLLTQPKLPCLATYHALNLTAGCPNECRYCYAQSFAYHPGWGTVAFYANFLSRLREELPAMREKPRLVYFSTACEPFLSIEPILDDLYEIMTLLLDAGVFLLIVTKGAIPRRFAALFEMHREEVFVQIGITTVDDTVREFMEPHAATVTQRFENFELLMAHGVPCEARMDPLIPGLTDDEVSLDALLYDLSRRGVHRATASYLFLRWGIRPPADLSRGNWSFREMRRLYTHKVSDYCGRGMIWLPPTDYRRRKYADLTTLAAGHNIRLRLCACKNKDLTSDCCHPLPRR
jgi:DNA repair photolyase